MLQVEFAELTDKGPVRKNNEDYLGHCLAPAEGPERRRGFLFVLADGVGGQERGEVASRLTVETTIAEFEKSAFGDPPVNLLISAIQSANTRVYEEAHGGIASTVVACLLRFDRAILAHAGDSRCSLIRRGKLQTLTRDHTVAGEQIRAGKLTEHEARRIPGSNVLQRSIGINLFVSPEITQATVEAGDLLLLSSDGLHAHVPGSKIAQIASSAPSLAEAARKLVEIANAADGGDNVSVQLIRIQQVEAVGMYRGRPYRLNG